jgi:hypothetical protein
MKGASVKAFNVQTLKGLEQVVQRIARSLYRSNQNRKPGPKRLDSPPISLSVFWIVGFKNLSVFT